ncbi:MAG: hypothetical protein AAF657_31475 [Acidobacteriota bacterium]
MAEAQRKPVPLLVAVTCLVETLNACIAARQRGHCYPTLGLDEITLHGTALETLLDDPTRDPKIRIAVPAKPGTTIDSEALGGVFFELLAGNPPGRTRTIPRDDLPPAVEPLLGAFLGPPFGEAAAIEHGLAEARTLGLDLLATWEQGRRGSRLQDELQQALEQRQESGVRRLTQELAEVAPESPWIRRAELWLDVRTRRADAEDEARRQLTQALYDDRPHDIELWGTQLQRTLGLAQDDDPDLELSRNWLRRAQERHAAEHEEARRDSLKVFVTGAPLLLATMLTGLLAVVMWLSA